MYSISKFYVIMKHYAICTQRQINLHTIGTGEKGAIKKCLCAHFESFKNQ